VAAISAAYAALVDFMRVLSGIIVFCIFVLIVADVFMRLAGLQPWLYASVLVEYGLLWFTMLAAPSLARTKSHVFIDAITQLLPDAARGVAARITYTICIVACLTFAWYAADLLKTAIETETIDTRAVDIPQWWLLAPIPLAFAMVAIEFIRFLLGFDSMYGERSDVKDNV
jgi:TRAP-type C4-dicarboxylate transport system permease small subunit